MASSSPERWRGILYLVAGVLLLVVQGIRFSGFYADWQAGRLDSTRVVISMMGLVAAMFLLRTGWRLRRNSDQNDMID
ncbi:hypothetical protein GCM10022408_29960 [Hymenobacter fastidiosus]|uniref:Uncharacterized protein n=1 Tax=Hymenobacter fastidiosus TaxID=486264 RepID=A0ABP7SPN7_9BACT